MEGIKFLLADRAKFHIGDASGGLKEVFSSDQLFSALINNVALLYSKEIIDEMIDLFRDNKFKLSSLFYGLDFITEETGVKEQSLYFLPRPSAPIRSKELSENELWSLKKIKKVAYLSIGAYKKLLGSWNEEENFFDYNLLDLKLIGGKFACTEEEIDRLGLNQEQEKQLVDFKFIKNSSRPKLSVDRISSESKNFYHQQETELSYGQVGSYEVRPFMFCLYQGEFVKKLKASFRLLAEEGIGGKRSRGLGHFEGIREIELDSLNNFKPNDQYYINLAILFPENEKVDDILSYQLDKRRGYIYSYGGQPYRKRSLRVITEGSILSAPLEGQLKNVTPQSFTDHEIFLSGKSFLIGFGGDN